MKGLRLIKLQNGGDAGFEQLQSQMPESIRATMSNYYSRLGTPEKQARFMKRANKQKVAFQNMPENQRTAYKAHIEQKYANPTDAQFSQLDKDLSSDKKWNPTYSYLGATSSTPSATATLGPVRTSGYYRDLSKEIGEAKTKLSGLTLDETEQKTRKLYNYVSPNPGIGPTAPTKIVKELPKGARQTSMNYGQKVWIGPDPGNQNYMQTPQQRGYYSPAGDEKYTVTTTRAQRAGDADYDKQMGVLDRLRTRHKYRNMPQFASSSGLSSSNIYQKLGMAKKGKFVNKYSKGGRSSIRGTKFVGVF